MITALMLTRDASIKDGRWGGAELKVHHSTISTHAQLHTQRLAAIQKVNTSTFYFQDDDDPSPNCYPEVERGILYGDMRIQETGKKEVVKKAQIWDPFWHTNNPKLIHKAFCNTRDALEVVKHLPEGNYWTEFMLYYFLAARYGFEYDKYINIPWMCHPTGFHVGTLSLMFETVGWVVKNRERVLQLLK